MTITQEAHDKLLAPSEMDRMHANITRFKRLSRRSANAAVEPEAPYQEKQK